MEETNVGHPIGDQMDETSSIEPVIEEVPSVITLGENKYELRPNATTKLRDFLLCGSRILFSNASGQMQGDLLGFCFTNHLVEEQRILGDFQVIQLERVETPQLECLDGLADLENRLAAMDFHSVCGATSALCVGECNRSCSCLNMWIMFHGIPELLISDNGSAYTSKETSRETLQLS